MAGAASKQRTGWEGTTADERRLRLRPAHEATRRKSRLLRFTAIAKDPYLTDEERRLFIAMLSAGDGQ